MVKNYVQFKSQCLCTCAIHHLPRPAFVFNGGHQGYVELQTQVSNCQRSSRKKQREKRRERRTGEAQAGKRRVREEEGKKTKLPLSRERGEQRQASWKDEI